MYHSIYSLIGSATPNPNLEIFTEQEHQTGLDDGWGIWTEIYKVSQYSNVVKDVFQTFDRDQVFIGFLENLSIDPYKTILQVCEFLQIDSDIYQEYSFQIENPTIDARWPMLYAWALQVNSQLEPLLNHVPRMRMWVRNAHHKFNRLRDREVFSRGTINRLKAFYETDRETLLEMLHKGNVNNLPTWLSR